MKKEDIASYIVYLIIVAVFATLIFTVITPAFNAISNKPNFNNYQLVFMIVGIIGSIIVNGIFIELFHMLGAKIGKYNISSVNILGFNFYKVDGKTKFRFKSFDGLTGETIVDPKYNENNECISKPKAMLWFGNLYLILIIVISWCIYSVFHSILVGPLFLVVLITTACMLFYNILPIQLDNKTDGYQLKLVSKKENLEAFNEHLRVVSCELSNKDPGETKVFNEITEYTAEINMVKFYKYFEEENYVEAIKILNINLNKDGKLSDTYKAKYEAHKLFILLFTNKLTEAKEMYETLSSESKKIICNCSSMECLRAYILISSMIDPSESEVQYATSRVDSVFKRVEALRKPAEKKYYVEAVRKVKEQHPNWNPTIVEEKK